MLRALKRFLLFTKKKPEKQTQERYERDKKILKDGDEQARRDLAADPDTAPEMLYYMADDPADSVRRAVAENQAAPMKAGEKLARDKNDDVRLALAERLVRLLPDLSSSEHGKLYAYTVQVLEILAEDEMIKIRRALSSALRDMTAAPPAVVLRLARDIEKDIAEPLLRYSLSLSDEDLLEVLQHHPEKWAAQAIAQRKTVSPPVSEGIFRTLDILANKLLLLNKGAEISEETLEEIIEHARDCPDWHDAIAEYGGLNLEMARKLVGFAGKTVFKILQQRKDFGKKTAAAIADLVRRRIAFNDMIDPDAPPAAQVKKYREAGKLNAETVMDALAWQYYGFAAEALAQLSGIPRENVDRIIKKQNAQEIVALVWKAGLPMRLALEAQKKLGHIQPRNLIYARGGTDYPFSDEEMNKILEDYL
ncbi:MAG: DUF2336 domain-containing protein [Micavibrio sp.]|nr:MAG: DUF2336 domain-containing protein [Micavibrio sp.]